MRFLKTLFVALNSIALTFAFVPRPTIAQSIVEDRIIYPSEFSPLLTSQSTKPQASVVPQTKFVKQKDPIPNRYLVVLNDNVVSSDSPLKVRRTAISAVAEKHADTHRGKVDYIYETALKGYAIVLPDEAAAIELSKEPLVKWVEEVGRLQPLGTGSVQLPQLLQTNPPWGLDAIDGSIPVPPVNANGTTNGIYIYNSLGTGVRAYVLDTGIRSTHLDFGNRAAIAADFIAGSQYLDSCIFPKPTPGDNDCLGHGTHVAGTLAGNTYGVAKGVTVLSVKVCTANFNGCPADVVINGVNWVTQQHQLFPTIPAVANMSLSGLISTTMDTAVLNSIASGVTYVIAAGNDNHDAQFNSPAHVAPALTVGATDAASSRVFSFPGGGGSNFGNSVDIFAPGYFVVSAWSTSNTAAVFNYGTSMATPHVAGAVAMYLQGRTGMANCASVPIQGPSTSIGAPVSTCPDRVVRFINSNANLNKLTNVNGFVGGLPVHSPNRFLWTAAIPTTANPIDNQRFFTWQQYSDFLTYDPDEGGLAFWAGQMNTQCGTGVNDNNPCVRNIRALVSKEFFRVAFPSAFANNSQFIHRAYEAYLRRSVPDSDGGFQFWLGQLNSFGSPASEAGKDAIIDAFLTSPEYRRRFGQP